MVFLCLYISSLLLSLANSPSPAVSAMYTGVMVLALVLAASFNLCLNDEGLVLGLRIYGLVAGAALSMYLLSADYDHWGRLIGYLSPNTVGLVAVSGVLASLVGARTWAIALGAAPSAVVLYQTNSRTAIVALAVGLVVWLLARRTRISHLRLALGMMVFGGVGLLVYLKRDAIFRVVFSVLAVDNPYRGIHTGFTGRLDAWQEAWGMFLAHPIVGVGFHMHESLMTTYSSAHNGYLTVLAETGLLGAIPVAWLIGRALKRYATAPRSDIEAWGLGFLCAYLSVALTERYLFNTGNPTSLLFLVLIVRGFLLPKAPVVATTQATPSRRQRGFQRGGDHRLK